MVVLFSYLWMQGSRNLKVCYVTISYYIQLLYPTLSVVIYKYLNFQEIIL